jgi:hypothetical protein
LIGASVTRDQHQQGMRNRTIKPVILLSTKA